MKPPAYDTAAQAATDRIGLTHAPRELAALTGQPGAISYRRIYAACVDGLIPAELTNGRWSLKRADLPAVAAALGFSVEAGRSSAA